MDRDGFQRIIAQAFVPSLEEMGLRLTDQTADGKQYSARFTGKDRLVAVIFEPGDNYLCVHISDLDGERTRILSDLNTSYLARAGLRERVENDRYFEVVTVNDEHEAALLLCAKDLKLVLPRYFADQ
ncbi:MAG: hypothetical protein KDA16_08300 [Phycisphaerales bacterium]|nr:hypothetical protein [Phycisphaerales bacterium]